jgi:chromosome segregation ATPase
MSPARPIAWERLFDAPEEKSLRTLRYELDLASSTIEKLEARIQELRDSPTLGFTTFLDTAQISALEAKLDELRRARDQTQARIAFLEGPPDTGAPAAPSALASDDTAGVQEQAKNLERIARELEGIGIRWSRLRASRIARPRLKGRRPPDRVSRSGIPPPLRVDLA